MKGEQTFQNYHSDSFETNVRPPDSTAARLIEIESESIALGCQRLAGAFYLLALAAADPTGLTLAFSFVAGKPKPPYL